MMEGLLNVLMGVRPEFYPFEVRIIEEVKSRMDNDSASRLQRQVEVINKIQRLADGKEVNLYRMLRGKPIFDDTLRFANAGDEALLASVILTGADKRAKLKADIWLAKGRLFSLVFSKPPKLFFAGMNLKSVQPDIIDVRLWFDPTQRTIIDRDSVVDASALTGWLRDWNSKGIISSLHAPLSESQRSEYLDRVDAQLPADYLELVSQTEGVHLAGCIVHGVSKIRQIALPDANYYVLAELEGLGALVVKDGMSDAELYCLHYEDNDVRPVGKSLQNAVVDLLKL